MEFSLPGSGHAYKPSDIAPQEHDPAWFLQWAKYIYSMWRDNKCLTTSTGKVWNADESIEELRAYARGLQDVRKYKKALDKIIKMQDNSEASLLNISWRTPRILSVYRERIIDRIMEMRYEPTVIAVDDASVEKKELSYLRDKLAASPMGKSMMAQAGTVPDNVTENALTMNEEEIEQYRQLGGYSLLAEIALSEAIQATVDLNRFFPSVYRQVLEDLVDLGYAHVEIRHSAGDRMQTLEYIDPAYAIIPQGNYDDGRDMTWGGYMKPMTLAAIRHESGFDEATMKKVAKVYRPYMGNAKYGGDVGARTDFASNNVSNTDRFTAMVMTAYFICAKAESFITGIHDSGSRVMEPVKATTKISDGAKARGFSLDQHTSQYVYKVNWIVGTDLIFGYGEDDVITRDGTPGNMQANFPIVTYRTNKPSVVSSCIGLVDDLCLNLFKKRQIISKMPPAPNIAINISALEQVTSLGSMRLSPEDLLDIYTVRGILFLAGDQDYGEPFQNGSPPKPIQEMPNGTLEQLQTIQVNLNMAMEELRAITGINEIADGSKLTSGQLSGVTESYNQSANRALSWLYTANESIQTQMYRQMGQRYKVVSAKGEMNIRYIPIGADTAYIVRLSPEFSLSDFQIIVKPGIDEMTKQSLLRSIQEYKAAQMITPADEMAVVTMISRGQHRKAQFYLATAVARKAKMDALLSQSNMQAQAQAQGEAGQMIEQAKQQGLAAQAQSNMQLLQLEYQLKNEFEDKQVGRKIRIAAGTEMSSAMITQTTAPQPSV